MMAENNPLKGKKYAMITVAVEYDVKEQVDAVLRENKITQSRLITALLTDIVTKGKLPQWLSDELVKERTSNEH